MPIEVWVPLVAVVCAVIAVIAVGRYFYQHEKRDDGMAIFPIVDLSDDDGARSAERYYNENNPPKPSPKADVGQDGEEYWFTATSAEVQASPWTYVQRAIDGETTLVVRSDTGDPLCFITPHKED